MRTENRRKNTSLSSKLLQAPSEYSFCQAVRLLERVTKFNSHQQIQQTRNLTYGNPVARFNPPSSEIIRFKTNQALAFSASEIDSIKVKNKAAKEKSQWTLGVNFIGLTGAQGVLPYHYTELILKRHKIKDESLSKFFDIFNHRSISLFYQSSTKYHLPIEYERKKLNPPVVAARDAHTQALLSLIGLGTKHLTNRQYIDDESLLYFSGLLSQQIKTASGLKQILSSYFSVPVEIKEFVGQWQEFIQDVRSKLPSSVKPLGQNNALGRSLILGKKGWFAQGKIKVILGPLNKKQAQKFAPDTKALYAINEIIQFYLGIEQDYHFEIRIKRNDALDKTQLNSANPPLIGWNTCLVTKPKQIYTDDETLDIVISAKKFQKR